MKLEEDDAHLPLEKLNITSNTFSFDWAIYSMNNSVFLSHSLDSQSLSAKCYILVCGVIAENK